MELLLGKIHILSLWINNPKLNIKDRNNLYPPSNVLQFLVSYFMSTVGSQILFSYLTHVFENSPNFYLITSDVRSCVHMLQAMGNLIDVPFSLPLPVTVVNTSAISLRLPSDCRTELSYPVILKLLLGFFF